ncbi:hypothetical protein BLNAU_11875 [Blattamonas nauphoetae]|uniref:Uncharacterized protein n=1 Tax=Blattamonas nauphoetae TaxID=2049346 RepID=A0ABQ9XNK2_9EUKA|nr:hypothetical protein BLNAU_11875 [Blattamonas nauphoetae]
MTTNLSGSPSELELIPSSVRKQSQRPIKPKNHSHSHTHTGNYADTTIADVTIPFLDINESKYFYLEIYRRYINTNLGLLGNNMSYFQFFPFRSKDILLCISKIHSQGNPEGSSHTPNQQNLTRYERLCLLYFHTLHIQFYSIIGTAARLVGHFHTSRLCIHQAQLYATLLQLPVELIPTRNLNMLTRFERCLSPVFSFVLSSTSNSPTTQHPLEIAEKLNLPQPALDMNAPVPASVLLEWSPLSSLIYSLFFSSSVNTDLPFTDCEMMEGCILTEFQLGRELIRNFDTFSNGRIGASTDSTNLDLSSPSSQFYRDLFCSPYSVFYPLAVSPRNPFPPPSPDPSPILLPDQAPEQESARFGLRAFDAHCEQLLSLVRSRNSISPALFTQKVQRHLSTLFKLIDHSSLKPRNNDSSIQNSFLPIFMYYSHRNQFSQPGDLPHVPLQSTRSALPSQVLNLHGKHVQKTFHDPCSRFVNMIESIEIRIIFSSTVSTLSSIFHNDISSFFTRMEEAQLEAHPSTPSKPVVTSKDNTYQTHSVDLFPPLDIKLKPAAEPTIPSTPPRSLTPGSMSFSTTCVNVAEQYYNHSREPNLNIRVRVQTAVESTMLLCISSSLQLLQLFSLSALRTSVDFSTLSFSPLRLASFVLSLANLQQVIVDAGIPLGEPLLHMCTDASDTTPYTPFSPPQEPIYIPCVNHVHCFHQTDSPRDQSQALPPNVPTSHYIQPAEIPPNLRLITTLHLFHLSPPSPLPPDQPQPVGERQCQCSCGETFSDGVDLDESLLLHIHPTFADSSKPPLDTSFIVKPANPNHNPVDLSTFREKEWASPFADTDAFLLHFFQKEQGFVSQTSFIEAVSKETTMVTPDADAGQNKEPEKHLPSLLRLLELHNSTRPTPSRKEALQNLLPPSFESSSVLSPPPLPFLENTALSYMSLASLVFILLNHPALSLVAANFVVDSQLDRLAQTDFLQMIGPTSSGIPYVFTAAIYQTIFQQAAPFVSTLATCLVADSVVHYFRLMQLLRCFPSDAHITPSYTTSQRHLPSLASPLSPSPNPLPLPLSLPGAPTTEDTVGVPSQRIMSRIGELSQFKPSKSLFSCLPIIFFKTVSFILQHSPHLPLFHHYFPLEDTRAITTHSDSPETLNLPMSAFFSVEANGGQKAHQFGTLAVEPSDEQDVHAAMTMTIGPSKYIFTKGGENSDGLVLQHTYRGKGKGRKNKHPSKKRTRGQHEWEEETDEDEESSLSSAELSSRRRRSHRNSLPPIQKRKRSEPEPNSDSSFLSDVDFSSSSPSSTTLPTIAAPPARPPPPVSLPPSSQISTPFTRVFSSPVQRDTTFTPHQVYSHPLHTMQLPPHIFQPTLNFTRGRLDSPSLTLQSLSEMNDLGQSIEPF